jgi:hypothetical protein
MNIKISEACKIATNAFGKCITAIGHLVSMPVYTMYVRLSVCPPTFNTFL